MGCRGVGEESSVGCHAHEQRTRTGHQMVEWVQGEDLRFLLCLLQDRLVGIPGITQKKLDWTSDRSRALPIIGFLGATRGFFA